MSRLHRYGALLLLTLLSGAAIAQGDIGVSTDETSTAERLWRLFTFQDRNTTVVVLGTGLLGPACGLVGTFMLLRKRALMSDALSHATLPGIGLAFIFGLAINSNPKHLPLLLAGALLTGLLGVGSVILIRTLARLREDAALAIVLSVFYGFGIAILGIIQKLDAGSAAGLKYFIYGKAASMVASDAQLIAWIAGASVLITLVLYKEFKLLCFDQAFASSQGWPVLWLDIVLMTLVTLVTVIGLQAVGLLLVIALFIIPPAAARFWTTELARTLWIAVGIGAVSCVLGAALSAVVERIPTGPIIVLIAAVCFVLSMLFGPARGVVARLQRRLTLRRRVRRQNLLRAAFEAADEASPEFTFADLISRRSWSRRELERGVRSARRAGLIVDGTRPGALRLTERGLAEARRVVRNHRLWELFLIHYADTAPGQVDRGADRVEHVLSPEIFDRLMEMLRDQDPGLVPASPHALTPEERS
jgi:manganese/zinc/iron transport system permease protein